jgi:hypothetical protein
MMDRSALGPFLSCSWPSFFEVNAISQQLLEGLVQVEMQRKFWSSHIDGGTI